TNLGDRPGAVGGAGGVTEVEHRLVRHLVHDRPGHGETTEPGVEDAYWGILHWARLRLGPDKGVAHGPDVLDLDLDPLPGLDQPDPGGGAGQQHVAGEQGERLSGHLDEPADPV